MSNIDRGHGAQLNTNMQQAVGFTLYGMSMDNLLPMAGYDSDGQGMVFFTRPQLNLSTENISSVREFAYLGSQNSASIPTWVRHTLDPRLSDPYLGPKLGNSRSLLVNNTYSFIPALSNLCTKVSGWPVRAVTTYTSSPGKYKEVYMQVDGRSRKEGPVNLTVEFARIPGNPVSSLLETWGLYPEYVFEGLMDPYIDMILLKEMDYNIRLFRFKFALDGVTIVRYGTTLPGIIMVSGEGEDFDYDRFSPRTGSSETVSFPMKFPAVEQNDPVILLDFNEIVETFKPNMVNGERESTMKFIGLDSRGYFKGYLYPYIDLKTAKMQTWVETKIFNTLGNRLKAAGVITELEELSDE